MFQKINRQMSDQGKFILINIIKNMKNLEYFIEELIIDIFMLIDLIDIKSRSKLKIIDILIFST